jgi:hypothetical protein
MTSDLLLLFPESEEMLNETKQQLGGSHGFIKETQE